MADTYTPFLNLTKPEIGGDPDTWGQLINDDLDKIDANAAANMPKAGGTFTGPVTVPNVLTISGANQYSGVILSATLNGATYSPRIQTDQNQNMTGFVNGANNAYNLRVYDDGTVATRNNLLVGGQTYAGGNNATVAPDGNVWGPLWGGWLRDYVNSSFAFKGGDTFSGRMYFSKPGWQAD